VSSFVQVAFPWIATQGSRGLPEGLEPADGVLTGVLARNALLRGTFRSTAGLQLTTVTDVQPPLSSHTLLGGRVALLGPTPRGLQVLTDVTASGSAQYRPGGVHRLLSSIVRAARRVGEDAVFEASNEALWSGIQNRLEQVLFGLWQSGGLRGERQSDAFSVRCDRSTMTQADLDAGRAIAVVQIAPASPIENITVVLALEAGGITSLTTTAAA
jgi:phage tail sheath protein FI